MQDLLRIVTVEALRGRTWAAGRVYDSPATPADVRATENQEPFIAVYCDDADERSWGDDEGQDEIRLLIEVAVVSAETFTEDERAPTDAEVPTPPTTVTVINETDSGLELQIGFLTTQAIAALQSTAPGASQWAELWRDLVTGVTLVETRRGGPGDQQMQTGPRPRFASRVTIMHCQVISDPPRGVLLAESFPVWERALTAMAATSHLAGVASLMRAHFEKPDGKLPDWRIGQKLLMLTKQQVQGIGIGPAEGFDEIEGVEWPAVLQKVSSLHPEGDKHLEQEFGIGDPDEP